MVDVSMTVLRRNEVNGEGRSPDPASAAFLFGVKTVHLAPLLLIPIL